MAKKMKKALCVVLSVIMALGCFAISGFAYTGYDHDGSNSSLKVQSVVSVDKASYASGDTVTATVALNHATDSIIGYEGVVAFDSSVLEFKSATLAEGFEFYSDAFAPVAAAIDTSALTMGYAGTAITPANLYKMMGTATFGALSGVSFKADNIAGLVAGSNDTVITLTFEAKSATSATNISLMPSVAYSPAFGYYNCAATTSTDGVYATAYSAIKASSSFEITGGSAPVSYDITFSWHDGSEVKKTAEGQMPVAPSVPDYSDGDYDYSFSAWSPELVVASSATTYVAQYSSQFVSANYDEYNSAVSSATAKKDNGTNWTADSLKALTDALAVDVSGLGRTAQSTVDAQTEAINTAAANLAEMATNYDITFVWHGDSKTTSVASGQMPEIPSVSNYEDDEKTYTFTGWDKEVAVASANVTYTAQYTETYKEYTISFSWNGDSKEVNAHWGEMPVAPTVPSYTADGKTFTFTGWTPTLVACAGNASYTAQYSSEDIYYTITFIVNGTETSDQVRAGDTAVAPTVSNYSDGDYDYTFTGWDKEVVPATANATYTAQFSSAFVGADYSAVDLAIANSEKITLSNYTDASVKTLEDAVNAVERGLGRTAQETVTGFATAINTAIDNLILKGANYAEYNSAVAQLNALLAQTNVYKPSSIASVTSSLEEIDNALSKTLKITEQGTVDTATAQVEALKANLVAQANKDALNTIYETALTESVKDIYTPESLEALTTAMVSAKAVIDNAEATQDAVDAQVTALTSAVNALITKADKSDLKAAIDEAEALSETDYVDFSAVKTALEVAKNVYADDNASSISVSNATTSLNNAIKALVLKGADYTQWNALINGYKNIDKTLYTESSIKAVDDIIAQVKDKQPVTYQDELNALCANLDTAIKNLAYITTWAGETDWNGVAHETFNSNLEFVQKVNQEDPSQITVEVYLNHPVDTVSGIQLATLFDSNAMEFESASVIGGSLIYSNTGVASFDETAFGLDSMVKASVLKLAADFTTPLEAANGVRQHIMDLNFKATGASESSYIKSVPLASNTTADKSVYSAILDANGNEQFMHNDATTLALQTVKTGTVTGQLTADNAIVPMKVALVNGDEEYFVTVMANKSYTISNVPEGTYTLVITAPGSLGYTVNNVVVTGNETKTITSLNILFGDANQDSIISVGDISTITLASNYGSSEYTQTSDVNGDGSVSVSDIAIVLLDSHYSKDVTSQTITLD